MAGPKKPQAWFDSKMLRKADTIEALAADCGIDATTLRATVDRYNAQVQRGVDDDFQRGENSFDEWSGDPLKADAKTLGRSEERRVGKECVGTCRSRVSPEHSKKKK